ncbi:cyclic lactone autoinducer peptide [Paenibacillus sp. GCM10027626]
MKNYVGRLLASALGGAAVIFVSTACWIYGHRPEVPAELLEK